MCDGKKRRKKKLKKALSQSNSEPAGNASSPSISMANEQNVPDEILQIKQEQMPSTTTADGLAKSKSQSMPINLTNEHGKVKSEADSNEYGAAGLAESMEMADYSNTVCKIGECLRENVHFYFSVVPLIHLKMF